jgi:hypothetical protein
MGQGFCMDDNITGRMDLQPFLGGLEGWMRLIYFTEKSISTIPTNFPCLNLGADGCENQPTAGLHKAKQLCVGLSVRIESQLIHGQGKARNALKREQGSEWTTSATDEALRKLGGPTAS